MNKLIKLQGKVQAYAWGGSEFLPHLLRYTHTSGQPQAEYWLGTHPSAPSQVLDGETAQPLDQYLQQHRLPELQFLLKILDVRDMLSIQAHPTREQAEAGFARENQLGIALSAGNRNYKDSSDKPELMVALSEFWLLHGFRRETQILVDLARQPVLLPLQQKLLAEGLAAAFAFALDTGNPQVQSLQQQLAAELLAAPPLSDKNTTAFWLQRWVTSHPQTLNGLLTPWFLNLVQLQPGEAIYQPAGLLHAYLEGQNVELMANSDNVLRAGLTPKHIDAQELLRICDPSPTRPTDYRIRPRFTPAGKQRYITPFRDFELSELDSDRGMVQNWPCTAPEIVFCYSGKVELEADGSRQTLHQGDACLVVPDTQVRAVFESPDTRLYKARNGTA
jgi:mannose-6-phosphate isomerase